MMHSTSDHVDGYQEEADHILQGLMTDFMEDTKALEWIIAALDLITGVRLKDVIYEYLNAGKVLDSILVSKILYLDHLINVEAVEIIQTLVEYRAHSSQKNHAIDCLISGKRYQGPIYNSTVREAKLKSNDYVRKLLLDLVNINIAAINIMARVI